MYDANEYVAAKARTQLLTVDISDDELERAAGDTAQAATLHCTQYWLYPF